MRLIDADAFGKALEKEWDTNSDSDFANKCVWRVLENAPTVEPERKKGKWILTEDDNYEYCTCSECGYQNGENWMNGSDIPFCANCGADMRG